MKSNLNDFHFGNFLKLSDVLYIMSNYEYGFLANALRLVPLPLLATISMQYCNTHLLNISRSRMLEYLSEHNEMSKWLSKWFLLQLMLSVTFKNTFRQVSILLKICGIHYNSFLQYLLVWKLLLHWHNEYVKNRQPGSCLCPLGFRADDDRNHNSS